MKKTLENLQNKPHHIRQSISIIVASALTLLIFVGWIASLPVRMQRISQNSAEESVEDGVVIEKNSQASVVTPFRTFFDKIASQSPDEVLPTQIDPTTIIEPVE